VDIIIILIIIISLNLTCSRHDSWNIAHLALNNNHSLTPSSLTPISITPDRADNTCQTIFALTPLNLSGEVENVNVIVFGLTRKWLQTHVLCSCLYGLVSLCKSYLRLSTWAAFLPFKIQMVPKCNVLYPWGIEIFRVLHNVMM
jgi:hypothetical protein